MVVPRTICVRYAYLALLSCWSWLLPLSADQADHDLPTIQELYLNYIQANGGLAQIQSLRSVIISGRISNYIKEDAVSVDFKLCRKQPNRMRMRMDFEQYSMLTIYDGEQGWRRWTHDNGATHEIELDAAALSSVRTSSSLHSPLYEMRDQLSDFEVVAMETVNGRSALKLQAVQQSDSKYRTLWLDAENYQELKLIPNWDELPSELSAYYHELVLSDYRNIDGHWMPYQADYYLDGEVVRSTVVTKVRVNVGVFDGYFSLN